MNKQFMLDQKQLSKFLAFSNAAFKDYLAARILINANQLSSGIVLANTALEKYFKLFLVVQGKNKRTHSTIELYNTIKKFDSILATAINEDFVNVLSKAYKIRYLEDLTENYNLVISQRKLLAELDYTVSIMEDVWKIEGMTERKAYYTYIEEKDENLFTNNHILLGIPKKDLIECQELDHYYQLQNHEKLGIIEINRTDKVLDDGIFSLEGMQIEVNS